MESNASRHIFLKLATLCASTPTCMAIDMAPKQSLLVLLAVVLLPPPVIVPAAAALDIGKILSAYPEFSVFSALLTQTGVARAVDGREVATVLAPDNAVLSATLRGVPRRLLPDLLELHVVLDYLDANELDALRRRRGGDGSGDGSVVATLLQGTGAPRGRGVGSLRVSSGDDGSVVFSSAAPGGGLRNATFEREVTGQPYVVSVLQVSGLVLPPGAVTPPPPSQPPTSLPPIPAPAPGPGPEPRRPPMSWFPAPVRPPPSRVIPMSSVHGSAAEKLPSAAGHTSASWWSAAGVALGTMACLRGRL